ncbi:MAG: FtsX-like permease family protein [Ruminococcaceae bacterium]|nr:FtsX-like permease family protein [Oscillospiraceae bacterium]
MSLRQSFSMAIKNIMSSKVRSLLTMLGIIIGVAAVIVITGLGNGMETYMTDSFKSMGTNLLTVTVIGRGSSRSVSEEDMYQLVEDNPQYLDALSPTVDFSGTVHIGTETASTTSVTGVSEDYLYMKDYKVANGRDLSYIDMENRSKVCVIGSYIAKEYFTGNPLGQNIRIGGNTFTIIGVMEEEADSAQRTTDDSIFIPYTTAARLSNTGRISSYTFAVVSEDNISESKAIIEEKLEKIFGSDSAYLVISLSEILDVMSQMIDIMVYVLAGIAAISLVVGGIGIMNIMLVSVTERTREIGIRKALGAKQRNIMAQFVIEAATTSALGGVVGIGMGYMFSEIATQVISAVLEVEMKVTPTIGSVSLAFGISVGIGILFGYLPAKKAARLNPIDALRYE